MGVLRRDTATLLLVLGGVGAVVLVAGLAYTLARQLRRRRFLPFRRYRGPSIVLQVALVMVLATALQVPFLDDAGALLFGEGEMSLLGAIVLLTSTQAALALVSWLFVFRPRAIGFAMPLLGPRESWLRAARVGFGWGVLAWIVASAVTLGVVALFESLGLPPETQPTEQMLAELEPWVLVLAIVVVAPIAEEIFFRGIAFNAWLAERGRRFAYIGSAILFAAIHGSLVSLLPIFLLGVALAWVYRRTRSLAAPIAMHATVNGVSVAIAMLVRYDVVRLPA